MADLTTPVSDEAHMRRALELAKTGEGRVSPNPPVGCVLVKNRKIIAEGWHDKYGDLHAEAMALQKAGAEAEGAAAYVTLSPCTTHGRQPPCADALIRAKVAKVIVAAPDPNPANNNGIDILNAAGIPARAGLLQNEAEYLARGFFKKIRAGLPYATLKYAMTLDGKIATAAGDSKWISNPASREVVQDMRSRHDAILTGIGTVLADDPLLNVRGEVRERRSANGAEHRQPARVIVDTRCRFPLTAAMLKRKKNPGGGIIIATTVDSPRIAKLEHAGAEVWRFAPDETTGKVPLPARLRRLAETGVNMLLIECGAALAASLLRENLVDGVVAFIAPKLIGGNASPGPVADLGLSLMSQALPLAVKEWKQIEGDMMLTSIVQNPPPAPGGKKSLPPRP